MRASRGFTLVELLVTLALIGLSASVILPLASVMETRAKEVELKRALRTMRTAIDKYKVAADAGVIDKKTGTSGYPESLDVLVQGVQPSAAMGNSAQVMFFLRAIPKDPFAEDQSATPAEMWNIRSYSSKAGDFSAGKDVFDVSSKSTKTGMDGSSYSSW